MGKDASTGSSFELTAAATATGYGVSSDEPKATTVNKLQKEVDTGFDVDPDSSIVDNVVGPTVASDGVHWRVRARASQSRHLDDAAIRSALAGRPLELGEITRVVESHGVELKRVLSWPGWWPRLPMLDARIQITKPATTPPP